MEYDAVILAGGRSSRLGGVPKAQLRVDGATLLERSLQAASGARRTVVVGPDPGGLPPDVLGCREGRDRDRRRRCGGPRWPLAGT
ncbi:molybdenum cofactor guanylyltransferase, partial [Arthrobacter sp. 2YAF22_2]|uniref:molybdenum cofactor guanylyltransferase n=1 Tax=Arthrobacter sp. 2YAF22_2 TaxID=3233029 RepID=UPI003F93EC0C